LAPVTRGLWQRDGGVLVRKVLLFRCYTFAMVRFDASIAGLQGRGAWPWRRCPIRGRR